MTRLAILLLLLLPSVSVRVEADEAAPDRPQLATYAQIFGDCVVRAFPRVAHEAVMAEVSNEQMAERYSRLLSTNCMGRAQDAGGPDGIRFSGEMFRSTLADSLIRRSFAGAGPEDFSAVPPLWHFRLEAQPNSEGAPDEAAAQRVRTAAAYNFMSRFGECVARLAPEPTRLLVLTRPGSADERAQFTALQPSMSACLTDGVSIRLSPVLVRGSLAYNYYRLAASASAPMQGTP
jgi:hypothetical protein